MSQCQAHSRYTADFIVEEEIVNLFVGSQFTQEECTTTAKSCEALVMLQGEHMCQMALPSDVIVFGAEHC